MKKCILLFCLLLAIPLPALAGEALVNSEADVDVTGKDAADAQAQAMTKGELDALVNLLDKLTTADQVRAITTNIDPGKIAAMVRGTEVLDERISSNRYRAHLIVTFDGDAINDLISKGAGQEASLPEAVGSFLVIPGYEEEGTPMLWEDANPWRPVWKAVGLENSTGDIVVPFGDNSDMAVVNARTIASATYASLAPMIVRYGVSDIILLQAKFARSPDMQLTVVRRHVNRTVNEVNLLTYRADPQETKDTLLLRAARDIADGIEHKKTEETVTAHAVSGGERNSVMVLATISTLASWTELRSKLMALPMIDRLELLAMAPQQVDMVIHYRGSPDSLANAITSQNIRLVKNDKYWVISRD